MIKGMTATRIFKNGEDGFWYYAPASEEVEIKVWPNRFLEVPFGDDGGRLIWMGLEVKTDKSEWKRKHVAFALEPYSHNWYGHAPFRPAAKTKAQAAGQLWRAFEAARASLPQPLSPADRAACVDGALEAIGYDPFETNRDWLTARLRNPMRLHWELEALNDQFAFGRSANYGYGSKGKENQPCWLFAVCDDMDAAVDDLTLELTGDYKMRMRLPDEPADIFDATLRASIRQALAGRDTTEAHNRPDRVAYTAKLVFTKHMEAAAARRERRPKMPTARKRKSVR